MSKHRKFLHGLLRHVGDLLNEDVPIPHAGRPPAKPAPRFSMLAVVMGFPQFEGRQRIEPTMDEKLALQSICREDVLRLADLLRAQFRYHQCAGVCRRCPDMCAEGPPGQRTVSKFMSCADRVLPNARQDWAPKPTPDEWKAEWDRMMPHLDRFLNFIEVSSKWYGRDRTTAYAGSFFVQPRTYQDAYLCLLAGFILPHTDRPYRGCRVVPCLACGRFYVADRRDTRTCSRTCRVRLHRAGQDAEDRRQRAREYKRRQRAREAEQKRKCQRAEEMYALLHQQLQINDPAMTGEQRDRKIRGGLTNPDIRRQLRQALETYGYSHDEIEFALTHGDTIFQSDQKPQRASTHSGRVGQPGTPATQ